MVQDTAFLHETASQTAGPYLHIGLAPGRAGFDMPTRALGHDIAGPQAKGTRIRIEGLVIDGTGAPVRDALLEIWQANAEGHYAHPDGGGPVEDGFRGWGRACMDFETGLWSVETVKPGPVPARGAGFQAPHLSLWLVARGINVGLHTRMYFEDEAEANALDPVLDMIEGENRRRTLVATRDQGSRLPVYRFDIRLQGERETVFFDI